MDDVQPVRPPPSPLRGHGGLVGVLIVVALLVVIVKPWGAGAERSVAVVPAATPSPTPSPTATPEPDNGYSDIGYDPSIFGIAPPPARWGILPVGFLVTFGFVAQVPDASSATASPGLPIPAPTAHAGGPSTGPTSTSVPPASPASTVSPADGGPAWPSEFDVPNGTHLLLIGINMPVGLSLRSSSLEVLGPDGTWRPVELDRYPPPWPNHFAVVGLPRRASDGHLLPWPVGRYRLTLQFDPTDIGRSIDIVVSDRALAP